MTILVFFVKEVAIKKLFNTTVFENIGGLLKGNKPFVILLVVTGIFSLGAFNFSFVLLKGSDLGINQSLIPIVYAIINVAHTIVGIPAGISEDRIGKEKVLILGYSIFAMSTIMMAFLQIILFMLLFWLPCLGFTSGFQKLFRGR